MVTGENIINKDNKASEEQREIFFDLFKLADKQFKDNKETHEVSFGYKIKLKNGIDTFINKSIDRKTCDKFMKLIKRRDYIIEQNLRKQVENVLDEKTINKIIKIKPKININQK